MIFTNTNEGASFFKQPYASASHCLMLGALSPNPQGLQSVLVGATLFLLLCSIVPGWMIWATRRSLFPRYNQIHNNNNKKLAQTSGSLDGLGIRNSKETSVLDRNARVESLGRAQG